MNKIFSFFPLHFPPSIALTFFFIAGIIGQWLSAHLISCVLVAFLLTIISIVLYGHGHIKHTILLGAGCLFFLGSLRLQQQLSWQESMYDTIKHTALTLTITLEDIQETHDRRFKYRLTAQINNACDGQLKIIKLLINKQLIIYINKPTFLDVGDTITFESPALKKPSCSSLLHYLTRENIVGYIFPSDFKYTVIKRPHFSMKRWVYHKKQEVLHRAHENMSPSTYMFFSSLFLGNRAFEKTKYQEIKRQFQLWGISHYLARSGLHLVVVISSWNNMLRYLPLSLEIKYLIMGILVCIYTFFSWFSISFYRAVLFFLCTLILRLFKHRINALNITTLVTLFVLFNNPVLLFFLDFQLSFGITFLLALFNHCMEIKNIQSVKEY